MESVDTTCYILPEGATREEPWTWEAIEASCKSGQFSPDTPIFFPGKNCWVRARDTELKKYFEGVTEDVSAEGDDTGGEKKHALEAEYEEALRLAGEQPEVAETNVDAGRLAAEVGDRETARDFFQKALELKPFNARIAQDVQRRFSKTECREFLYLRRDPPPWEQPEEALAYPLAGGPVYLAVTAAVLFVLSLVPFGMFLACPLVYLWGIQIARSTAGGSSTPPLWHAPVENPVREIILPLIAGIAVAAQCGLVVYGAGRLVMLLEGDTGPAFEYVAGSPVLSVTLTVIAIAYLPAVFVRITHSTGIIVDLLSVWVPVRTAVRMGSEYAMSALVLLGYVFLAGAIAFVTGGIPVLGKALSAAAGSYMILVNGFVLGRLMERKKHVL